MILKLSDLWRWRGTVDRLPYLLWGIILFLIKSQLDRHVVNMFFQRDWSTWSYLGPGGSNTGVTNLHGSDLSFYATLVALALPFIYSGVALTLRRLRAARLPLALVVLFFVPVINLFFFFILSILPSKLDENLEPPPLPGEPSRLDRFIPSSALGSALLGMVVTALLGVGGTLLGVEVLGGYGWGLFVGLPFCLGLCSVLIYGYHENRSVGSCMMVALLALALTAAALLCFALEGAVCLVMAAPLAVPLALLGASIGHSLISSFRRPTKKRTFFGIIFFLPAFMGAEHLHAAKPPLLLVQSSLDIDAPPEEVWRHVLSFSALPEPDEWLFRLGPAYPIRAKIQGKGAGAVRHCVFSTGAFVEPIQVWDEPRLLKFSVTANPPPMQEWTFYSSIHPPHLDGFLVSKSGQFLLTPLPNSRTRLEGTTWYQHTMWPAAYWQLWSDFIIHRIHLRVLKHIKRLAEFPALSIRRPDP